jgi:thiol-disulfide isomerase/thioredoxin
MVEWILWRMYIMQKAVFKTLSIFMLVLFVMSVTGAAATSSSKAVANADKFSFSPTKKCGNVLSNDKGSSLKVTTTGTMKTSKGAKVSMKSNGYFCYYPATSFKTGTISDSFTYKIVDKYKKYSTARVTISYKCTSSGSTPSQSKGVVQVTQLDQINTALKTGPVLLKLGAEWCGPCKSMKPILEKLATEYAGKATIMSADIDKSPKIADYFGVNSIPDTTVIVGIQNGKYVYMQENGKVNTDRTKARIVGLKDKAVYEKVLDLALR